MLSHVNIANIGLHAPMSGWTCRVVVLYHVYETVVSCNHDFKPMLSKGHYCPLNSSRSFLPTGEGSKYRLDWTIAVKNACLCCCAETVDIGLHCHCYDENCGDSFPGMNLWENQFVFDCSRSCRVVPYHHIFIPLGDI